jgi:hypothetical protein
MRHEEVSQGSSQGAQLEVYSLHSLRDAIKNRVVSLLFGIGFSRILGDRRLKRKVRDGTRSTILYQ